MDRIPTGEYVVVLCNRRVDVFRHHDLQLNELVPAFARHGLSVQVIDYMEEPHRLHRTFTDPNCRFYVCFNGFGSEIVLPSGPRATLLSPFHIHGKPLFDIMHDLPLHDSMEHQFAARGSDRHMLVTDYGYAMLARLAGYGNVRFVDSIAYPQALSGHIRPYRDRRIEVLLPINLPPPRAVDDRHRSEGLKGRVYSLVYEAAVEQAVHDWSVDPLDAVLGACTAAGLPFDINDADSRFLLSTVLDKVKFERRWRLVSVLAHLPITLLTGDGAGEPWAQQRARILKPMNVSEMFALMGDSRAVICPNPHITGHHERTLGALTAGAAVLAASNRLHETQFMHGREILFFRHLPELVEMVERVLSHPMDFAEQAEAGRARVMTLLPPERLVDTMMALFRPAPPVRPVS